MARRLPNAGFRLRAGLVLAALVAVLSLPESALGFHHKKSPGEGATPGKPTRNATQPPAFSIPVEPLGFFAPAAFYQGERESLVSLDFLDENRLLFTFRAPGLIHRTKYGEEDERRVRAVVLSLPGGLVDAEALWSLHDRERYLWMMKDGHFLLRDRDTLKEGDSSLELTPLLQFPGPVLWMEMDPTQQFIVTDSQEPSGKPNAGHVGSPVTAQASISTGDNGNDDQPDMVLRILQRESGKVMLVSRVRTAIQLPINPDGYLETLRSTGRDWLLNLNYFTGGSRILGKIESSCQPPVSFISRTEALANTCAPQGGRNLVAVSTEGRRLWTASCPATQVWPLLVVSADGSTLARETLTVSHPVDAFAPLSFEDVTGQLVEVYDTAQGMSKLKAPASPVLDGGGNVAISPSGKRVAVLNAGAIQIYELGAQPPAGLGTAHKTP